jgi:hypothetical protein
MIARAEIDLNVFFILTPYKLRSLAVKRDCIITQNGARTPEKPTKLLVCNDWRESCMILLGFIFHERRSV